MCDERCWTEMFPCVAITCFSALLLSVGWWYSSCSSCLSGFAFLCTPFLKVDLQHNFLVFGDRNNYTLVFCGHVLTPFRRMVHRDRFEKSLFLAWTFRNLCLVYYTIDGAPAYTGRLHKSFYGCVQHAFLFCETVLGSVIARSSRHCGNRGTRGWGV